MVSVHSAAQMNVMIAFVGHALLFTMTLALIALLRPYRSSSPVVVQGTWALIKSKSTLRQAIGSTLPTTLTSAGLSPLIPPIPNFAPPPPPGPFTKNSVTRWSSVVVMGGGVTLWPSHLVVVTFPLSFVVVVGGGVVGHPSGPQPFNIVSHVRVTICVIPCRGPTAACVVHNFDNNLAQHHDE